MTIQTYLTQTKELQEQNKIKKKKFRELLLKLTIAKRKKNICESNYRLLQLIKKCKNLYKSSNSLLCLGYSPGSVYRCSYAVSYQTHHPQSNSPQNSARVKRKNTTTRQTSPYITGSRALVNANHEKNLQVIEEITSCHLTFFITFLNVLNFIFFYN